MREHVVERLGELRAEYEAGQRLLAELETRQVSLRQSMLRISGAIQVLEELLGQEVGVRAELEGV